MYDMVDFVRESNRIERIFRDPTDEEVLAHEILLYKSSVVVEDLIRFVEVIQPDAVIRDRVGLDVCVGRYIAPRGRPGIVDMLSNLLADIGVDSPWQTHCYYESLHPFTDGNGRSGRALWLWSMAHQGRNSNNFPAPLGFLHEFYYQTLEEQQISGHISQ
tara:strand:- start:12846 stop:13325 length:480 start_codon:yes stop_codon:yes gene_type:complete